ncbi:MAG: type III-A CRISPR-associated RAMP protein Csm5 [Armatimonadota bacterium]|nr:type III-A CRISPR-associated RAMP protein Csm5 [Armatimonadota bacterium]
MMPRLASTTTYTVQCLSPVHVGTEERLGGHDFLVLRGTLYRVDAARLLVELEQAREARDRYLSGGLAQIAQWLQQGDRLRRLSVYSCPVPRDPRRGEDLRPFLADPLGRPYVPGTELKGAVRTAVLWQRILQAGGRSELARRAGRTKNRRGGVEDVRDRRFAGEWLEETVLGEDPRQDTFRVLRVRDSTPAPAAALRAYPVLVAARQSPGLGLMESPRQGSQPSRYIQDVGRAVASFCECLHDGVELRVPVEVDRFLLESHDRWGTDAAFLESWPEACNAFARSVAEQERQWWTQAGSAVPPSLRQLADTVTRFYTELLRRLQSPPPGHVVLNLGWGGGWRTKTVTELFGEDVVQQLVRRYRLDRGSGSRPFPKTRKVAWVQRDRFLPMGWVVLIPG